MAEPKKTIKPGWKTTEWWLSLLTTIGAVLLNSGLIPADGLEKGASIVAALAMGLGYTLSRTVAKK